MADVHGEIDIKASPKEILDVIADLPAYPSWSAVHRKAVVDKRFANGRPARATMRVTAAGLADEQVLTYKWERDKVTWDLVHASQQKAQHGSYTLEKRPDGVSHVTYALTITPSIPVPGLIVRAVMRNAVNSATSGLKREVERRRGQNVL